MIDEASYYTPVGREFAAHCVVRHNEGEYGRGDVTTNTIEGFFSVFKRGMKGVYSTAERSICIVMRPNSNSATIIALPMATMIWPRRPIFERFRRKKG